MNSISQSILEKEYLKKLQNLHIKVVSFDIFDTLVMRSVSEPIDIFKKTGEHKYVLKHFGSAEHFKNMRIQAEKNARNADKSKEDISLREIYQELWVDENIAIRLMEIELEAEDRSLHVNPQIERWIELAVQHEKRVILISDMYLNKKHIEKLVLSKIKNAKYISNIYMSSEYRKTKHFGTLYPAVLKEENIEAINLLHIGDNEKADCFMASAHNIESIFYSPDKYMLEIAKLEKKYANLSYETFNHHYRKWAMLQNPYNNEDERFYFNEGAYLFGPILWEFSKWIEKIAKENNIDTIFCIMREGRVFKKCLDMISPNLNTKLLYASRKSTILPSMATNFEKYSHFDIGNFQFRKFTIQDFFDLFGLDIGKSDLYAHKDVEFTELKRDTNRYSKIAQSISVIYNNNRTKIANMLKEKRKIFEKYCKQLKISKNSMLVDFGGGGTIIENICKVLPDANLPSLNALFYLHSNRQVINIKTKTLSFLPNINTNQLIYNCPRIYEILFNGVEKTTHEYSQKNNQISPILKYPNPSIHEMKHLLQAFDNGMCTFINICNKKSVNSSLYDKFLIEKNTLRLIDLPHIKEAIHFGNLYHDEGYGTKKFEYIIEQRHINIIKDIGLKTYYYEIRKDLFYRNKDITWHQGAITKIAPDFIAEMLALKEVNPNENALKKIMKTLDSNQDIKEVYMYGAGEFGLLCLKGLKERNIKIKGVIDASKRVKETGFYGLRVKEFEDTNININDVIVVASVVYALDITDFIKKNKRAKSLNVINCYDGLIKV